MPALFRLSFVEVETLSTPVSPCASSSLRHQPWQRRSSAVEAPRSQTPSLRRPRGRRKAQQLSRTLRSGRHLHGRALLRGRKQRHHHLLFLCRRADVGVPKVELSVLRFDVFLDLHGQTPFSPRVPLVTKSKCVSDHVRPVGGHTRRRKRFCTVDRCEI